MFHITMYIIVAYREFIMNIIRLIDQLIIKKVLEILIILCLIVLALTLIHRKSFQEIFQEISYFRTTHYTQIDTEINDFSYTIHLINETYTEESFQLMMEFQEDFFDPEKVYIKINGHSVSLNNFKKKNKNTFLILNDTIKASEKKYIIELIYEDSFFINANFYLENILKI